MNKGQSCRKQLCYTLTRLAASRLSTVMPLSIAIYTSRLCACVTLQYKARGVEGEKGRVGGTLGYANSVRCVQRIGRDWKKKKKKRKGVEESFVIIAIF